MIICIVLIIIGLVLLTRGADYFVEGASDLALKFKIPPIIVGLTIVAMGTSAPEAVVSINSSLKGVNEIAIGNVLGSNIANILLILGATSAISALTIKKNTIKYEIPFVFFITLLLLMFCTYTGEVTRLFSVGLLVIFLFFLLYLYKMSKTEDNISPNTNNLGMFKITLYIIGGLSALIYGGDLTINSAVNIAKILNISDRIIGLTIIAIGTSLPELITCISAALKKQSDIAVGNIVGSNIFNILFVLGLTGVVKPIPYNNNFTFDGIVALISVLLLYLLIFKTSKLVRYQGFIFIILYAVYLLYLILQ